MLHFGTAGPVVTAAAPLLDRARERLRVVNTYHLFASITRERIEPELADRTPGDGVWTPQHLRHKPGDPRRAPDFVAPHQPRVDFQLWFYGLSFQRREPTYVATLVERLCEDPAAVQPLFRAPLPAATRGGAHRLLAVPVHEPRGGEATRRLVAPERRRREPGRPVPEGAMTDARADSAEAPAPARNPGVRAASLGTLFLTVFLDLLGFGLVIPFLPGMARQPGRGRLRGHAARARSTR